MSENGRPIYYVTGEKGGVGKSFVAKGVLHWCETHGENFVVIDSDTSNPDVARACGAGMKDEDAKAAKGRAAAVRTLPLDFLDGWAELVDCAKKYPEAVLVVNAGARGQLVSDPGAQRVWGVADAAEHGILAKLKEAGRPFLPLWVTDGEQDSILLLKRFRAVVGEGAAEVNVVKNWGLIPVGTLAPWTYFDDSETAKAVTESDGRIMEYPPLAMRVARQLVNRRLSIARGVGAGTGAHTVGGRADGPRGMVAQGEQRARSGTRHGEIESVAETRGLARITEELTGQPPTASQLQLLGKAIRAVGLRPDDPLLPLFVALGYHQRLYEEIPGKVAAAAKEATEESKSAVNAAARETVATLVKEVGKSAQAITKNVAAAEQRRWRSELLYRTSITTLIMLLLWLIAFGAVMFWHRR